jgi:hypothetical protein
MDLSGPGSDLKLKERKKEDAMSELFYNKKKSTTMPKKIVGCNR